MGRIRKECVTSLLCISLLCGCDRAGKINPELTKVSVDAAGTVTYTDEDDNVHYGQDAWGDTAPATSYTYDPTIVGDKPGIDWDVYFSQSAYNSSVEEAKTAPITTTSYDEVIVDIPIITNNTTSTTIPPVIHTDSASGMLRPTIDNYSEYSYDELYAYYKHSDSHGFYKHNYVEHCSYGGYIGQPYDGSYDEACAVFIDDLGQATVEYTYGDFTHSYWLTPGKVYSVTKYKSDDNVSICQGYYNSDWETTKPRSYTVNDIVNYSCNGGDCLSALYKELGSPTHCDSFVLIWRTANNIYIVDRRSTYTIILEV